MKGKSRFVKYVYGFGNNLNGTLYLTAKFSLP